MGTSQLQPTTPPWAAQLPAPHLGLIPIHHFCLLAPPAQNPGLVPGVTGHHELARTAQGASTHRGGLGATPAHLSKAMFLVSSWVVTTGAVSRPITCSSVGCTAASSTSWSWPARASVSEYTTLLSWSISITTALLSAGNGVRTTTVPTVSPSTTPQGGGHAGVTSPCPRKTKLRLPLCQVMWSKPSSVVSTRRFWPLFHTL